jgi:hypothetical protein
MTNLDILRRKLIREMCRLVFSEDEGDPEIVDELLARIREAKQQKAA